MYLMASGEGYRLAGMSMDAGMLSGMVLILVGLVLASYGLLPATASVAAPVTVIAPPEAAPLSKAHWGVALLLTVALIIDVMKPASLGFVTPGMRVEYGISSAQSAWLPLTALTGTTIGSFLWGVLGDIYGRRAAILLSSVVFVATSICGAMPDFAWNLVMCFLMGLGAGGMLPVAYALLAEIIPTRHRGWMLVLIGGVGAVGGYFAASFFSALLQPQFGWRIMWFLNLPTGLLLIALSPLLPESARFLQRSGRADEAWRTLERFGVKRDSEGSAGREPHRGDAPLHKADPFWLGAALTLAGVAWGLVSFGVLLWLPGALVAEGRSVGAASAIIAQSSLISLPVVACATVLYARWSTKGSLLAMIALMTAGLAGVALRKTGVAWLADPAISTTLMIVGSSGVIAILLPYTAEQFHLRVRGRATGWVAGSSKFGGLIAQCLSVGGLTPPLGVAALLVVLPSAASFLLIGRLGQETRGRDLRDLEPEAGDEAARI